MGNSKEHYLYDSFDIFATRSAGRSMPPPATFDIDAPPGSANLTAWKFALFRDAHPARSIASTRCNGCQVQSVRGLNQFHE